MRYKNIHVMVSFAVIMFVLISVFLVIKGGGIEYLYSTDNNVNTADNRVANKSGTHTSLEDYELLLYTYVPYMNGNIVLEPKIGLQNTTPVKIMKDIWRKVFNDVEPKILVGLYSTDGIAFILAQNVKLAIFKINSSYYNISLIFENITVILLKSNSISNIADKIRFTNLLYEEKVQQPFEFVRVYKKGLISCTVYVDRKKGFYYYKGELMGTWPFIIKLDNKVLFQVLPKSFFVGDRINKLILDHYRVKGFVSIYTLVPAIQDKVEPIGINIDGRKGHISSDSMIKAVPISIPLLGLSERNMSRIIKINTTKIHADNVEVTRTFIEIDGKMYDASWSGVLPPYVFYYDNKTGLLIEEKIDNEIVKKGIPSSLYSFMIPTPLHNVLGEEGRVIIVPLNGYTGLKMVLLQAYTSS